MICGIAQFWGDGRHFAQTAAGEPERGASAVEGVDPAHRSAWRLPFGECIARHRRICRNVEILGTDPKKSEILIALSRDL